MPADLEFTGERFVPGIAGEIAHEHWHRYAFARRYAAGKRVLDAACGEGYGSALLAGVAAEVTGIDIDAASIAHARANYAAAPNVRFEEGSAAALPLPDASVDVVVSFETIEHLPREMQPRMLAEFARVLTRDGVLVLSAPNPVEYSTARNYRNPFHQHEPDRAELETLLDASFPVRRWFRQRRYFGSAVWGEAQGTIVETWTGDVAQIDAASPPAAMYFVVVAARSPAALPVPDAALSLFTDRTEAELARIDTMSREVMRQDGLLRERDAGLARQGEHVLHLEQIASERDEALARAAAHVKHLEDIAAYSERIVVERDAQVAQLHKLFESASDERDGLAKALGSARQGLVAQSAECERFERALAAQERIIAYRQSARWWLSLPWLRVRLWWQRMRGA
ncbi:MAG: methyltransferase domain-containing protein [Betaproteobacteria bacterium]